MQVENVVYLVSACWFCFYNIVLNVPGPSVKLTNHAVVLSLIIDVVPGAS